MRNDLGLSTRVARNQRTALEHRFQRGVALVLPARSDDGQERLRPQRIDLLRLQLAFEMDARHLVDGEKPRADLVEVLERAVVSWDAGVGSDEGQREVRIPAEQLREGDQREVASLALVETPDEK